MSTGCDYFDCPSLADLITKDDAKFCAAHYKTHTGWGWSS